MNFIDRQKEIEIDVVGESIDRKSMLVGECKWTSPDFADRQLRIMKSKVEKVSLFAGKDIIYVLFLREPPIGDNIPEDVHVVYPDDVIDLLQNG